jgi:hypothetical protein
MGLIAPDLTGSLHGDDLKPAIETILRELNGNMSDDNIIQLNADKINAGTIDATIVDVINLVADNITAGKLASTDGKTYFDLDNDVLIVNDGSNDRVMIGKLS